MARIRINNTGVRSVYFANGNSSRKQPKITKTNSEWVYLSAATRAGTYIRYNKANVNIAIIVKLTRVENALQQLTGARGEYRFARMR